MLSWSVGCSRALDFVVLVVGWRRLDLFLMLLLLYEKHERRRVAAL